MWLQQLYTLQPLMTHAGRLMDGLLACGSGDHLQMHGSEGWHRPHRKN